MGDLFENKITLYMFLYIYKGIKSYVFLVSKMFVGGCMAKWLWSLSSDLKLSTTDVGWWPYIHLNS